MNPKYNSRCESAKSLKGSLSAKTALAIFGVFGLLTIILVWTFSGTRTSFKVSLPEPVVTRTAVDVFQCVVDRGLLDIEIQKQRTGEEQFTFFAKLINPREDASELMYRWTVKPPEGSAVSKTPQDTYRLNITPDVAGAYHVILSIGDKNNNCKHAIYVFHFPNFDELETKPSFSIQASFGLEEAGFTL